MNFSLPFSYVFEDPDWIKKIGLVALCQLIPILGQIIGIGFVVEIMQRLLRNHPTPLPELDFSGFLEKGFKMFVVSLVYSIPMVILTLPLNVMPILVENMQSSNQAMEAFAMAVSCICGGLSFLYGIFIAFITPAAFGRFAATESIGAALQIGELIKLVRKSFSAYLIAVLGSFLAGLISGLGVIACVIGIFVTLVYAYAVMAHFYAQAYRQAVPV